MAELKLSSIWKIKDFAEQNSQIKKANEKCFYESDELLELRHASLPGLHWSGEFYTASPDAFICTKDSAGFWLCAQFGDAVTDAKYVWASYAATLIDGGGRDHDSYSPCIADEYCSQQGKRKCRQVGAANAFRLADVTKAVRKDGSLWVRIDLAIIQVGEILQCRDMLRGLLTNRVRCDFEVKVGQESFKLHQSVLAQTSTVFQAMFESGMEEAEDGVLTLTDTTPTAFKAFSEAIYFDNWDFLSDIDLSQQVLFLADKYNVGNLKRFCDESLAEKINDANALEILTNSAALCNAEKTTAACVAILAEHMEFKESDVWLAFKKRSRGVALEILDSINDKLSAVVKRLLNERDAAKAELKRKCDEDNKKGSTSKRRK